MPLKHKLWYAAAFLHLLMTALFAGHFVEWGYIQKPPVAFLSTLGNYTGSNNIFSFFAPGLSNQPYVVYVAKDAQGHEKKIDFTGNSPDFLNRITNIYGYLTIPEARSVLSASLAQAILQKNPEAKQIRVVMLVQYIPEMEEYRSGKRSTWRFWFQRDFIRDSTAVTTNE